MKQSNNTTESADIINEIMASYINKGAIRLIDGKMVMVDDHGNTIGGEIKTIANNYGYIVVSDGEKYGMISNTGRLLLPMEYDAIYERCNGYAVISKDNKYGFFCDEDQTVCQPEYDEIDVIDMMEYVRVRKGDTWGYVHYGDMSFYAEDDEDNWPEDELFYSGAD